MNSRIARIVKAALNGFKKGALFGIAIPFITGAAFSVITTDITKFFMVIGQSHHTIILWGTVVLFSASFGGIYALIAATIEVFKMKKIDKEFEDMMNQEQK